MTAYCLRHRDTGHWWSHITGWQPSHSQASRLDWPQAQRGRDLLTGATITTPPHWNGHVVTWDEVKENP